MTTTTRETSRESWRQLCASGLLGGKQAKALDHLIDMGQATSGEVIHAMGQPNVNLWRARFTELQARGLIVEVGVRNCKISGRRALVWEYSGRTKPLEVKARATAREWKAITERAIKLLRTGEHLNPKAVDELVAIAKAAGAKL